MKTKIGKIPVFIIAGMYIIPAFFLTLFFSKYQFLNLILNELWFVLYTLAMYKSENNCFEGRKAFVERKSILLMISLFAFSLFLAFTCLNLRLRNSTYTIVESKISLYIVCSYLFTCILTPIVEECIFRKIIIGRLLEKHSALFSIIISSFLFGMLHLATGDIFFGIEVCLVSLIYGYVYMKTKNLLYSITMHCAHNMVVVFSEESNNVDLFILNKYLYIYIVFAFIFLLISILLLRKIYISKRCKA